jgi:DNA-binding transcriptional LysR family regulator
MHQMNLRALDLNLLVALEALLAEVHVGKAARRVGLSQPAMSHALARLRHHLSDPLMVRVGSRMDLTPRAIALRDPLSEILEGIQALLVTDTFDPSSSTRRFRLMLPDLVAGIMLPNLMYYLGNHAPNMSIEVMPWQGSSIMTPQMERTIDLIVTFSEHDFSGFCSQLLYTDTDVTAVRTGHPMRDKLTEVEAFLTARHVAVVGHGEQTDSVDDWLATQGLTRNIALTVPTYLQALRIVSTSDLVGIVPGRIAAALSASLGLSLYKPPAEPGVDRQMLFWPLRAQNDHASLWLRETIVDIMSA